MDRLLRDILAALPTTTIRNAPLRDERMLLFGEHHPDGTITINESLLRVTIALHELTHHVRPELSERAVRRATLQLLYALSDDAIAVVNQRVQARMRASRPPTARRKAPVRSAA